MSSAIISLAKLKNPQFLYAFLDLNVFFLPRGHCVRDSLLVSSAAVSFCHQQNPTYYISLTNQNSNKHHL